APRRKRGHAADRQQKDHRQATDPQPTTQRPEHHGPPERRRYGQRQTAPPHRRRREEKPAPPAGSGDDPEPPKETTPPGSGMAHGRTPRTTCQEKADSRHATTTPPHPDPLSKTTRAGQRSQGHRTRGDG